MLFLFLKRPPNRLLLLLLLLLLAGLLLWMVLILVWPVMLLLPMLLLVVGRLMQTAAVNAAKITQGAEKRGIEAPVSAPHSGDCSNPTSSFCRANIRAWSMLADL